jgi:hypothetical protein
VLAGQHYKYLLRQMTEIRDGHRRNANPDMVKVIKPYTNEQLVAISAYQASLSMPGSMCKAGAAKAPRRNNSRSPLPHSTGARKAGGHKPSPTDRANHARPEKAESTDHGPDPDRLTA